jgi:Fe-S oxidoreductase
MRRSGIFARIPEKDSKVGLDELNVANPGLNGLLLAVGLALFVIIFARRMRLLRLAAPDPRLDHLGTRFQRMLVVGFGQSRQPRYLVAGVLHIIIFAGFLILLLRSLTLLGQGFVEDFSLPGLDGRAGLIYATVKDYTALAVLSACIIAVLRRLVFHPARYRDRNATTPHTTEAYVILGLISALMIADGLYEGSVLASSSAIDSGLPLAGILAVAMGGAEPAALAWIHMGAFWVHNILLLGFLCYLPLSKHFHVITAIPNVFFHKVGSSGTVKPPRHEVADSDELDQLGVGKLEDFTWKHILDFYTCTDCGRCSDQCPAYTTGTVLSPRMISIKSRDLAYSRYQAFGTGTTENGINLVGDLITPEELWSCTTCGACEETCPVMIEYIDKIVDMRRFLVDQGDVPAGLQKPLQDLERRGNPYGKPPRLRAEWLAVVDENSSTNGNRVLSEGDQTDVLLFTDSAAALDPRIQKVTQSFAAILETAGVDWGTMGADEVDSGNEVRRIGEEGLFEALREQNQEAFESRRFERVVTTDPHALNALRNDGYDLGRPVLHHSQVLAALLAEGRISPKPISDDRTYTFHDPCYLGRHNGVYDDPRAVLAAIPGLRTVEMDRSRNRSFCCGGGSLNLFFEQEGEERMGEKRLSMAREAGADVVVTACPFCTINLEDAAKTSSADGSVEVIDLAELLAGTL